MKRSEEKWHEVMTCDVSPVAMFLIFHEKLGEALKIITRTIHHISHLNVVESQEIKVLMKTFMGRTWRTRGNFKLYDWKCGLLRCNFDLYWEATFHKIASHALHEFPSKFADLYRKWGKFLASIVLFVLSPNFSCASISQTPLVLQKQMSAAF